MMHVAEGNTGTECGRVNYMWLIITHKTQFDIFVALTEA
jgi:hypothetical protein